MCIWKTYSSISVSRRRTFFSQYYYCHPAVCDSFSSSSTDWLTSVYKNQWFAMLRTEFDNDNGWESDAARLPFHCLVSSHNVFTPNIVLIRQSTRRKQGGVWAEQHAVRPETDQRRRRESDDVATGVTPPPSFFVYTLSVMWCFNPTVLLEMDRIQLWLWPAGDLHKSLHRLQKKHTESAMWGRCEPTTSKTLGLQVCDIELKQTETCGFSITLNKQVPAHLDNLLNLMQRCWGIRQKQQSFLPQPHH